MKHLILCLGLITTCNATSASPQFVGRWDLRDPARAITVNTGSHIKTAFEGTGISARFDPSGNQPPFPTLAWRIDEGDWQQTDLAAEVTLAANLPKGRHTLVLFIRGIDEHQSRWKPPLVAAATFLGFRVTDGQLIELPKRAPPLRIEFLGDSITEGVLVHVGMPGPPPPNTWPWLTDGRENYAGLTGARLDADWRCVGFGGQGVTKGGSGGVPTALDTFEWIYEGVPRDKWQADVVVVNHGTNDGEEGFRDRYRRYLALVRKAYPHAHILAMRPFRGDPGGGIKMVVGELQQNGDKRLSFVDTTGWLVAGAGPGTDYSDGLHPNEAGSKKIADRLVPIIKGLR